MGQGTAYVHLHVRVEHKQYVWSVLAMAASRHGSGWAGHQSRAELSGAEQSTAELAEERAYILNRRARRIVLDYVGKRTDSDTS